MEIPDSFLMLRLRVTLTGSAPPIWREIRVPDFLLLAELHDVLQIAMGWEDCHLHVFTIRGQVFSAGEVDDSLDAWDFDLADFNFGKGQKIQYEYDFGDCWTHEIRLVAKERGSAEDYQPRCDGGARACPPEDCGGIHGFYNLLEIRETDPEDEMAQGLDDFDPEKFDLDSVNEALDEYWQQVEAYEAEDEAVSPEDLAFSEEPYDEEETEDENDPMFNFDGLPKMLQSCRVALQVPEKEAAKALGIKIREYRDMERGDGQGLDPSLYKPLAEFLGMGEWFAKWLRIRPGIAALFQRPGDVG